MKKTVIFIMGTGHCGSTLIDLILGSHPLGFSLGELTTLSRKDILDQAEPQICGLCSGPCSYWNKKTSLDVMRQYLRPRHKRAALIINHLRRKNFYAHLFEWFEVQFLIDSSKDAGYITRQLAPRHQWRDNTPVLLYVVRDGRAVINSYMRKYPENGVEKTTEDWKKQVLEMNAMYQGYTFPKYTLHYEQLALNPAQTIEQFCDFLGVDFQPAILHYWEHDHHIIKGNAGTRSLILKYRQQTGSGESPTWFKDWQGYYGTQQLSIELDMRWKTELAASDLAHFEAAAGDLNASFAYDG